MSNKWKVHDLNGEDYAIFGEGKKAICVGKGLANAHLIATAQELYKYLDHIANGGYFSKPEIEALLKRARGEG